MGEHENVLRGCALSWIVAVVRAGRKFPEEAIKDEGFGVFNPKRKLKAYYRGRKVDQRRPLFERYMFADTNRWTGDALHRLLTVRGIEGVLMGTSETGAKDYLIVVPEREMDNLKRHCKRDVYIEEGETQFVEGQEVRATKGHLAGRVGKFVGVRGDGEAALFEFLGGPSMTIFKLGDLAVA